MKFFIEIDFFEIAHAIAISNYIWETYVSKCEEFENEVNPESRKKIKDSLKNGSRNNLKDTNDQ